MKIESNGNIWIRTADQGMILFDPRMVSIVDEGDVIIDTVTKLPILINGDDLIDSIAMFGDGVPNIARAHELATNKLYEEHGSYDVSLPSQQALDSFEQWASEINDEEPDFYSKGEIYRLLGIPNPQLTKEPK